MLLFFVFLVKKCRIFTKIYYYVLHSSKKCIIFAPDFEMNQ